MADNVAITAGTGTTMATDDVGGVQYPRVKLAQGADGAATDVSSAAPLQVTLANGSVPSHAVTNAGTFAVQNTAALVAGTNNIGDVDVLTIGGQTPAFGAGASGATVQRVVIASDQLDTVVAHDAVDSGSPYKQGGRAVAGLSGITLVAAADRTDSLHGLDGAQFMRPHCGLEDIVTGNATNTDGTSTQCIASSGAGVKTYLTSVVLCNTSATAITVDIKDGSTTKVSLPLPAGSGCIFNPPVPIPGTAATAWNFDGSAAATTVTCSMVGFKSKI